MAFLAWPLISRNRLILTKISHKLRRSLDPGHKCNHKKTVLAKIRFRMNLYELREGREMSPKVFKTVVSNLLYERRYVKSIQLFRLIFLFRFGPFFIEPVIAALNDDGTTFLCGKFSILSTTFIMPFQVWIVLVLLNLQKITSPLVLLQLKCTVVLKPYGKRTL